MSKYTTEVRYICESLIGLEKSSGNPDAVISQAWPIIFDGSIPVYEESYRPELMQKILRHYYTREIGAETYALWRFRLNNRMKEIMPYYNLLYTAASKDFDIFQDVDLTEETLGNKEGSKNENANETTTNTENEGTTVEKNNERVQTGTVGDNGGFSSNSTKWDLFADTPQGGIQGIEDQDYLTTADKVTDQQTGTNNNTQTTDMTTTDSGKDSTERNKKVDANRVNQVNSSYKDDDNRITVTKGKSGGQSYQEMLKQYFETVRNIDMEVIVELSDLFIQIY